MNGDCPIDIQVARLHQQFPMSAFSKMVRGILEESLAFYERKLALEYARYDEATKKGVAFSDRQGLIVPHRVAALEKLIAEMKTAIKGFRAIPYEQWLDPMDYGMMKALGFKQFIKIIIHRVYAVTAD